MLVVFARTLILYGLVVLVMRLMGKQQVGQLQPFELVIAIMLSELAAIPMQDTTIPLLHGIIPIFTLLIIQIAISYISLKSLRLRKFFNGTPSILIAQGKIMEEELRRIRYSLTDLLEVLRTKNFPNIADVEYAILETNGDLSVIPKAKKRAVTLEDLNLPTNSQILPLALILDGKVIQSNLARANLNTQWLQEELKKHGVDNVHDVLIATLDSSGNLYFQLKDKAVRRQKNWI